MSGRPFPDIVMRAITRHGVEPSRGYVALDHPEAGTAAWDGSGTGARAFDGELVDPASGVRALPGELTAIVSANPEDSAAIAARLGRTVAGRHGVRGQPPHV